MNYIAPKELLNAKEVAQYLKRPLLLSGEPGTGKTTFADYVAETEKYSLHKFYTKSISISNDLFYNYDTISHFANKEKHILHFIRLQALGIAILNVIGKENAEAMIMEKLKHDVVFQQLDKAFQDELISRFLAPCTFDKSIVLIDEVDKAPRDFPNDILNEIENNEFEIKELGLKFSLKDHASGTGSNGDIFVILTSNFEKNLPDAFLRRCIYYNIKFPGEDALLKIVLSHLKDANGKEEDFRNRIREFIKIRGDASIQKKPATSELIDFIKYLIYKEQTNLPLKKDNAAIATIIKKQSDLDTISI